MSDHYEALTQSVRDLIDATIRSEVDADAFAAAKDHIDRANELLRGQLIPDSFGVRAAEEGRPVAWGNVLIGLRNPIAPPLDIQHAADGRVHTDIDLGAPYEGPPGHVHGGVAALVLDHVLGATAHRPGSPAFTGTLSLRYVRPTRLGRLRAEAWVDREEGSKTFAVGHISDSDGVTVEAHGVFIRPRRDAAGK
jgi:acyl-coenzyme A thioesterase PaaI-like protein